LETTFWQASRVVNPGKNNGYGLVASHLRNSITSHQEWFSDDLNARLSKLELRLRNTLDISSQTLEYWQACQYKVGARFDYHLDCGCWKMSNSGERRRSIIIFLDTPTSGGATHFRALNLKYRAKAGRLLVWNNLLPTGECNYAMIHSGRTVWKGRKTILVTWQRQAKHRS
jgi:prolyl 4-hydroxylase